MPVALEEFLACQGMNNWECHKLAQALNAETYAAGDTVLEQGRESDHCYFLFGGRVSVRMQAHGHDDLVTELGPGTIFGEMGMILNDQRSASIVALTDVEAATLSRGQFLRWLEDGESCAIKLLLNVIRVQSYRLRNVNQKFIELSHQQDNQVRAELEQFRQKLFGEWSF